MLADTETGLGTPQDLVARVPPAEMKQVAFWGERGDVQPTRSDGTIGVQADASRATVTRYIDAREAERMCPSELQLAGSATLETMDGTFREIVPGHVTIRGDLLAFSGTLGSQEIRGSYDAGMIGEAARYVLRMQLDGESWGGSLMIEDPALSVSRLVAEW